MPAGRPQPHRGATFIIRATLHDVSVLGEVLHAFRDTHALEQVADNIELGMIELGIIEALTNVVKHGHAGGADARIEVLYQEFADRIVVEIIDRGRAMPPAGLDRADERAFDFDLANLASLPESGMGLALIKRSFDSIDYSSSSGENRLRLMKSLGGAPAAATAP